MINREDELLADQAKNEKTKEERLAAKDPFEFLVNSMLSVEDLRIATQIRSSHLRRFGREDANTEEVLERLKCLEAFLDERIAGILEKHPAHPWFSRVKGIGKENIGKVIGFIDIKRANTVSGLWKYAGYHVVNGKAPRPQKNERLSYNKKLRTMCWRVGGSLIKAKGKFYDHYVSQKERLTRRYIDEGIKIVPANSMPKEAKGMPPIESGFISQGHLNNRAFRKMIKLFLSCLWVVWRKAVGLPTRVPYAMEYQGHTNLINPWDMVDCEEKPAAKKRGRPRKTAEV